ncbi:tyrosine-type recombinase/integrase [Clostridium tyrobutyricum]|uniref:tyrosine-type recombinase/integrase n=1 Tax=Clostridium tyrobutyricum TaxID=1519 RepID=UPI001C38610B|nr:site-specific integrase [Clostridium tyrobutyricum]MBV4429071.1 tyrosine-type recombinase/integrase [Clostridium tyrobutyricum]MBV4444148.1 tyrosine-type recombinase/integrase [Clostridium tyrobutyricum]
MKKKIILEDTPDTTVLPQNKKLSISQVQEEFESSLKERNLRPATLSFYNRIFECFYKFKDYREPIYSIDNNTINGYIDYCRNTRKNNDNTISTNVRGLKTFLLYAMRKGYLQSFKIKVPTPDTTPKTTYSVEEVQKLLVKPNLQHCAFSEYIAYTAINIFVYTGCRVSTAINIKISDIDLENNLIYFRHTKNKKPHCVPLAEELRKVLSKHFKLLENQNIKTEYILISAYGEQLNTHKLYQYIRSYNKKRGVQTTALHAFRRFYIKSLVLQGVPIPKIQYLVQHKTTALISLYTHLYSSDLTEDVQKFADNVAGKRKKLSTHNRR